MGMVLPLILLLVKLCVMQGSEGSVISPSPAFLPAIHHNGEAPGPIHNGQSWRSNASSPFDPHGSVISPSPATLHVDLSPSEAPSLLHSNGSFVQPPVALPPLTLAPLLPHKLSNHKLPFISSQTASSKPILSTSYPSRKTPSPNFHFSASVLFPNSIFSATDLFSRQQPAIHPAQLTLRFITIPILQASLCLKPHQTASTATD